MALYKARLFDGQTSLPKEVVLQLDTTLGTLVVLNEESFEKTALILTDYTIDFYATCCEIRLKADVAQFIRIENIRDHTALHHFLKSQQKSYTSKLYNQSIKVYVLMAAGLMTFCLLFYIYVLPVIAGWSVNFLPLSLDESLGETVFEALLEEEQINEEKSAQLQNFVDALNLPSKIPLKVYVVESDQLNAFALPNGNIVVFTELLNKINSSEALVALIGHEAEHVMGRHSTKMICQNLAGYLFISLIMGDVNAVVAVVSENAHTLNRLSYSRGYEQESDLAAFHLLKQHQLNPKGLAGLMQILKDEELISVPAFLSSHPLTDDRIEHANSLAVTHKYAYSKHPTLDSLFNVVKGEALE